MIWTKGLEKSSAIVRPIDNRFLERLENNEIDVTKGCPLV